jgi:ferredoxin
VKIVVDTDLCEGNGVCESVAPELFRLDGEGRLHVQELDQPTPQQREGASRAIRFCPKSALRLSQDDRPSNLPERKLP